MVNRTRVFESIGHVIVGPSSLHTVPIGSGSNPLTPNYLRSVKWVRTVTFVPDIDL